VAWDERYLLDNQQAEAGQRFDALSVLFNPSTFRHARAVGLGVGWRVWEVGAGSSSAPAWFAEQVGSEGHVLATDIDTSWLEDDDLSYEIHIMRWAWIRRRRAPSTWCTPGWCWCTCRNARRRWPP
jgi:hypothetical protein